MFCCMWGGKNGGRGFGCLHPRTSLPLQRGQHHPGQRDPWGKTKQGARMPRFPPLSVSRMAEVWQRSRGWEGCWLLQLQSGAVQPCASSPWPLGSLQVQHPCASTPHIEAAAMDCR